MSTYRIGLLARLKRRTHPATTVGNERIRQNLRKPRAKRSKARTPIPPPTEAKREWAEKEVDLTGIPEANLNVYELLPEVREAETKRI